MSSWSPPGLKRWFQGCAVLLISLSVSGTQAQDSSGLVITPSNQTEILKQLDYPPFSLKSQQLRLPSVIELVPLSLQVSSLDGSDLKHLENTYPLVSVTPSNSASGFDQQIALLSCDPFFYSGEINASDTFANVVNTPPQPAAVILYSTQSRICVTNEIEQPAYFYVFTVLNATSSIELLKRLAVSKDANMSSIALTMSATSTGSSPSPTTSPHGSGNTSLPDSSPTTAVAMIILYSITGVITALFLGIIVTGAIRAHRHPERYGPSSVVGRPRQSRARGLARAMLATIPIVKFGDDETNQGTPAKGDVELASAHEREVLETNANNEHRSVGQGGQDSQTPTSTEQITAENQEGAVQAAPDASNPENPQDSGNHVCPICTDDFEKGQDVRVLPCNHQFHPTCVDPWLINVSGTCPLCRIDLNPSGTSSEPGEGDSPEGERAQTPEEQPGASSSAPHSPRMLSGYLSDPRGMHSASVEERLAALRQMRRAQSAVNQDQANESTEEDQRRMSRLTQRLRDRFRIRTRPHGEQPPMLMTPTPQARLG